MAKKEAKTKSGLTIGKIKSTTDVFLSGRPALKQRWDDDFDLWRQLKYNAGKGYYSYTSNSARVLIDKLLSLINTSHLIIQIPSDELTTEDRKIASAIEKFLYGAINLNDTRLKKLGQPILRDALAWLFLVRGGAGIRTFVNKDNKGKTKIEIVPWDLYSTAYSIGADGVDWAVHKRMATRESIFKEYPNLPIAPPKEPAWYSKMFGQGGSQSGDDVAVYDYWDERENGIIVENVWAKEPEKHGCDRCPVDIIQVGSMPSVTSTNATLETEAYRGDGALAANRNIYPILNKTLSDYLAIVRRGVKTPLQFASSDGKKTLDKDIFEVEKAAVIPTERDDVIKPIIPPSMPKDADDLLAFILGETQRGGLSHISMGELNVRLSGYAISELQQSLITTLSPFIQAMERAYVSIADALIEQFASGGYKPIEVMGYTSRGVPFGYPKQEKIKTTDLEKDWRPIVKLVARLPKDDAQRMQLANIARQGDPPLMSHRDILEDYLEVQDPDQVLQRIDEQWGNRIPMVRLQKTFQAYVEAGEMLKASLVLEEMKKLMQSMEAQLPKESSVAGGKGAMQGMSPETMTMEETGVVKGASERGG